ncbi:hypothetical protein CIHG_10339 [Coccidioides immitis H538.4]|uniref:Uncharacterized protein n=3 Tax=Coccidioides immitis TaxID=5501 RepID=A0A0J8R008_COCIT|nr:hypothetical protein CIRG_09663 [Coccidioides immitis RMSCC 2394]KMU78489.1 hypothetical protein CISG_07493 [Coccidioides immitis RMSCC 3703]KMU92537.1 hypothetical protein CIHG_10339 [Coccidioides immitis H538.4]
MIPRFAGGDTVRFHRNFGIRHETRFIRDREPFATAKRTADTGGHWHEGGMWMSFDARATRIVHKITGIPNLPGSARVCSCPVPKQPRAKDNQLLPTVVNSLDITILHARLVPCPGCSLTDIP